jgi:F1F0 ATPase subunit 2
MSEAPQVILALVAGTGLGAVFFAGLWWTINRAVASQRPAAWFLGSLLVRTSIAVGGLYLVSRGDWRRLVGGLVGFILARHVVLRATRPPAEGSGRLMKEGGR